MIAGYPISGMTWRASSRERMYPDRGTVSSSLSIAFRNRFRSSAFWIASKLAPISSTPNFCNIPISCREMAMFSPVCPPMVGSSASGRSRSMIFPTISGVIGSTYVLSAKSVSVMIVAGLLLTRTTSYPSSRRALHACVPE